MVTWVVAFSSGGYKIRKIFAYKPIYPQTTYTQRKHKSKESENLGPCGRQNMFWDWDLIFSRAVMAIFSPGVRSSWKKLKLPVVMNF